MSPLSGFLAVIVSLTAILVAYLTKQFQNENLNYLTSNPMTNSNPKVKTIEKEKVVAETLNGRFAMLGLIAAVSPILIIGAIGIVVALAVFFLAYKKYFNSPFNKELQLKKKALLKEKTELNKKLEKIEQDLKNL